MNNLKSGFKLNKELLDNLTKLREDSPEKFFFLETFMKAIVNKEQIKVSISLDDTNTVSVTMGEYIYKELFSTFEEANSFIDNIRNIKKEIA